MLIILQGEATATRAITYLRNVAFEMNQLKNKSHKEIILSFIYRDSLKAHLNYTPKPKNILRIFKKLFFSYRLARLLAPFWFEINLKIINK